jgi:hypothetical protein
MINVGFFGALGSVPELFQLVDYLGANLYAKHNNKKEKEREGACP